MINVSEDTIESHPNETNIKYIKSNLKKIDLEDFINIVGIASTYSFITNGIHGVSEGTHQFIRDIQTTQILRDKFPNMYQFDSADEIRNWLQERLSSSPQGAANALNILQGQGAGEVDFVREMQGNLRNLYTKTDFVRDASGRVASNTPGIDVQEVNRFTGNVIDEFQVKSLRTTDSINETIKKFINNKEYSPNTTLAGPKELIEEAKTQGLPNPMKIIGSIEENKKSTEALKEKILSGNMVTEITPKAVLEKVAGGALIGAAFSVGISSLYNFILYKKGKISKKDMFDKIGKDGAKGAITGGSLAGLSLFIPGGIIGFGVGMIVGVTLRRTLDDAFGDGTFAEVLDLTRSVQANVNMLHEGSIYIADLVEADGKQMDYAMSTVNDLSVERLESLKKIQEIEKTYHNGQIVKKVGTTNDILSELDIKRKKMEGEEDE